MLREISADRKDGEGHLFLSPRIECPGLEQSGLVSFYWIFISVGRTGVVLELLTLLFFLHQSELKLNLKLSYLLF